MDTLKGVRDSFLYRHSSWSEEYFNMDTLKPRSHCPGLMIRDELCHNRE